MAQGSSAGGRGVGSIDLGDVAARAPGWPRSWSSEAGRGGDGDDDGEEDVAELVDLWDFINGDAGVGTKCSLIFPSNRSAPGLLERGARSDEGLVSPEKFEEPCVPIAMSGGTAAFYCVRFRSGQEPEGSHGPEHYIGKDLAHATDEVGFYDKLREVQACEPCWRPFGELAMDCPGVVRLQCVRPKDGQHEEREVLLLENLFNGFDRMRFLDVKVGAETSAPNWKGKSKWAHWRNGRIDVRTNSNIEGFRLEGMEQPPRAFKERLEALGGGNSGQMRAKVFGMKASKRFTMQRLRASEFLDAWLDLTGMGEGSEVHAIGAMWAARDSVSKLFKSLSDLPAPQQWIGSSLALGMEVGSPPASQDAAPRVTVKVFDWGRAELLDAKEYQALRPEQKAERIRYWRHYVRAIARFHWELSRIAVHRCCVCSWAAFVFEFRSEPLSVLRAFTVGVADSQASGISTYELPASGGRSAGVSGCHLALPLLGRLGRAWGGAGGAQEEVYGLLHVRITWNQDPGSAAGMGPVVVNVQGATQLPADIDDYGACANVVRVIGFEHAADARAHAEAWRAGLAEPCPLGRAYGHTTPPGGIAASTLVWEAPIEFHGVGPEGAELARQRLGEGTPNMVPGSPSIVCEQWPELLPPTLGDRDAAEAAARRYASRIVPWLDDPKAEPPSWNARPWA